MAIVTHRFNIASFVCRVLKTGLFIPKEIRLIKTEVNHSKHDLHAECQRANLVLVLVLKVWVNTKPRKAHYREDGSCLQMVLTQVSPQGSHGTGKAPLDCQLAWI